MLASAGGLLALSCSPEKDMELLAGKCSLFSETVLLSPDADTLRGPLLLLQGNSHSSAPASQEAAACRIVI